MKLVAVPFTEVQKRVAQSEIVSAFTFTPATDVKTAAAFVASIPRSLATLLPS